MHGFLDSPDGWPLPVNSGQRKPVGVRGRPPPGARETTRHRSAATSAIGARGRHRQPGRIPNPSGEEAGRARRRAGRPRRRCWGGVGTAEPIRDRSKHEPEEESHDVRQSADDSEDQAGGEARRQDPSAIPPESGVARDDAGPIREPPGECRLFLTGSDHEQVSHLWGGSGQELDSSVTARRVPPRAVLRIERGTLVPRSSIAWTYPFRLLLGLRARCARTRSPSTLV